jgi:hypothetical protein
MHSRSAHRTIKTLATNRFDQGLRPGSRERLPQLKLCARDHLQAGLTIGETMNTQAQALNMLQVEPIAFHYLRRILVVGCVCLLGEGIIRLLGARPDLEVFQVDENPAETLMLNIEQIHPDVIILCNPRAGLNNSLAAGVESIPHLAGLIIIDVDLRNTDLKIYQHSRWFSAGQSSLFSWIYGQDDGS